MHLIKLCNDLAAVANGNPQKRDWTEIFMDVATVCQDTEAQINADMADKDGSESGSGSGMSRSPPKKRGMSVSFFPL